MNIENNNTPPEAPVPGDDSNSPPTKRTLHSEETVQTPKSGSSKTPGEGENPSGVPTESRPFWGDMNTPNQCETLRSDEPFFGNSTKELSRKYQKLVDVGRLTFNEDLQMSRLLGAGGQGEVYLCRRNGTDGFQVPVAFKFFSPSPFASEQRYTVSMHHHAKVASIVNQIQQENLVNVHNWYQIDGIRVMEMEWVDGFDLQELLTYEMFHWLHEHCPGELWRNFRKVVFTEGITRPRLKPGIVIKIIRDCLNALHALHEHQIIHSDVKCSNIMLKRTGSTKIIDIGAAFVMADNYAAEAYTPRYAAPEVVDPRGAGIASVQSDIASLGYVLIELLAGCYLFNDIPDDKNYMMNLVKAKENIIHRLPEILPGDVLQNGKLVNFCRKMVHPDLTQRFRGAQDAILSIDGLAELHRQLIRGGLASEFDFDISSWINALDAWEGLPPKK